MQLLVQAEKEASLIPEGMRVLPEEERLEMLSLLEASKADTEARIRVYQKPIFVSFVPTCLLAVRLLLGPHACTSILYSRIAVDIYFGRKVTACM